MNKRQLKKIFKRAFNMAFTSFECADRILERNHISPEKFNKCVFMFEGVRKVKGAK